MKCVARLRREDKLRDPLQSRVLALVTPIFIHVNLPHVLINMYSLWIIGPWVEKLYGSAKFVVFWVATGVGGVLRVT